MDDDDEGLVIYDPKIVEGIEALALEWKCLPEEAFHRLIIEEYHRLGVRLHEG